MSQVKLKELRKKIEGTDINYPYYPGNSKCVYCQGTTSTSKVKFKAQLKNGQVISPVCTICVEEQILKHPHEVDTIKNIGAW